MKHIIKSLIATSVTMSAFAMNNQQQTDAISQMQKDPNPSSRFGTKDSWNFFIAGEVLWVKPLTSELSEYNDVTSSTTADVATYTFFQNKFQVGGRATLGLNTSYDGWDAMLTYTGFEYKHNNTLYDSSVTGGLYGSRAYVYYYNQGDLDFGRMFKVSDHLNLRPHVGVRALWLTQKVSDKFASGTSVTNYVEVSRIKSQLVGAEAGCDTLWEISKEFSAYANLGLTTLVNSQKAIQSYNVDGGVSSDEVVQTNYGTKIVNGLDFAIGLRWDRNFSDGDYHFGINAGYEHHSLLNMNTSAYTQAANTAQSGGSSKILPYMDSDFSWQGVALGLRFDF